MQERATKILTLSSSLVARGQGWDRVVKARWHLHVVPFLFDESVSAREKNGSLDIKQINLSESRNQSLRNLSQRVPMQSVKAAQQSKNTYAFFFPFLFLKFLGFLPAVIVSSFVQILTERVTF